MLDYLFCFGIRTGVHIGQVLLERELDREFNEACEENERTFERLNVALSDEKKMSKLVACFDSDYKKEISRLVTYLNNYKELKMQAEPTLS